MIGKIKIRFTQAALVLQVLGMLGRTAKFCVEAAPNIGVAWIFDWGGPKPQTKCNDVIRNFEGGIFCGSKDIVKWKIRSRGLVLARN